MRLRQNCKFWQEKSRVVCGLLCDSSSLEGSFSVRKYESNFIQKMKLQINFLINF